MLIICSKKKSVHDLMTKKGFSMKVNSIAANYSTPINRKNYAVETKINKAPSNVTNTISYEKLPLGNIYGAKINFTGEQGEKRTLRKALIPRINFEDYKKMTESEKEDFRKKYKVFQYRDDINYLVDNKPEHLAMPLQSEETMDKFIEVADWYNKYKDHPIICLGRSPKWFLNTSLWMKDGLENYDFAAFSGYWYRPDPVDGMIRVKNSGPTQEEYEAYKKYLTDIEADPLSIIIKADKAGEKAIITDYVETGKGFTSYLDVMADIAEDQGVLDKFGKSFDILSIGSLEYTEDRKNLEYKPDPPKVIMPEKLQSYDIGKNLWEQGEIKQEYFDMSRKVFDDMLYNQNSNECRSAFYPHYYWGYFSPNKYKTNNVHDPKEVQELLTHLHSDSPIFDFDPLMSDFRNLLNFRILDALNQRNLLKEKHVTRM